MGSVTSAGSARKAKAAIGCLQHGADERDHEALKNWESGQRPLCANTGRPHNDANDL
jgi:hypothetical protein